MMVIAEVFLKLQEDNGKQVGIGAKKPCRNTR